MSKVLQLEISGKRFDLTLPQIKPAKLISGFISNLVDILIAVYLIAAPWAITNSGLTLFYLLALLLLAALLIRAAKTRSLSFKDSPLLMTVILFAILNMSMILLPNHKPALISSNFNYNSGLTLMSVVVLFYYISSYGSKYMGLTLKLGLLVGTLISLVNPANAANWIIVFLPALAFVIIKLRQTKKLIWLALLVLIALTLLSYWFYTINFVELFWVGTTLALFALWQGYSKLKDRNLNDFQIVFLVGAAAAILAVLGMARLNFGLGSYLVDLVSDYRIALELLAANFIQLFTGGLEINLGVNLPFALSALLAGGLAGLSSLIVLVVAARSLIGKSNWLLVFVVTAWPVLAAVLYLPISAYLIWWVCLAFVASKVARAKS